MLQPSGTAPRELRTSFVENVGATSEHELLAKNLCAKRKIQEAQARTLNPRSCYSLVHAVYLLCSKFESRRQKNREGFMQGHHAV